MGLTVSDVSRQIGRSDAKVSAGLMRNDAAGDVLIEVEGEIAPGVILLWRQDIGLALGDRPHRRFPQGQQRDPGRAPGDVIVEISFTRQWK